MKNLLKYIVPIIMAIAFIDGLYQSDTTSLCNDWNSFASEADSSYFSSCTTANSDLSLPRQISSSNGLRLQTTGKRCNPLQKSCSEFIKAGKAVNSCIRYSTQEKSIIIRASYIKPAVRLIILCKLII